MKSTLRPLVCLLAMGWTLTAAEPEARWATERGIKGASLVTGSTSPDGKHALFEYHQWEGGGPTTITGIGLAPVDRSRLLFVIDSLTRWQTDKEVPTFLTWAWNADSSLVATHDRSGIHSRVNIYRIAGGKATSVDLPDLLPVAVAKLGIKKEKITASGQSPFRWERNDLLEITVRVVASGGKFSVKIPVAIDPQGRAKMQ